MHQASAHQSAAVAGASNHTHRSLTHFDPILIGLDPRGNPREWSFPSVANFNAIFLGGSGAGKTHTLHHMVANVFARGTTFHVIDIKGDFKYENFVKSGVGHLVQPEDFHDLTFNYYTDGCSVNPLQVPKTVEGGGVFRTIENVIELVKVFNPSAGGKQLGYLTDILKRVYNKAGIDHDDMDTWRKPSPTFANVLTEIDLIIASLSSGMDVLSATSLFQSFGMAKAQAERVMRTITENEGSKDQIEEAIVDIQEAFKADLIRYAERLITFENLSRPEAFETSDWVHWSKESLLSLKGIIQVMVDTRLFTQSVVRPRPGAINRYDLGTLSPRHQQVIMRIVASQVFAMGVMDTKRKDTFNPQFPAHILVADEGKHIKEISSSPISPFNRIGTEGRGYGVGAWAGLQSPDQVTKDLLKNSDTTFILKTPDASVNEIIKLFAAKPNQLKQLEAKKNALFGSGGSYTLVEHFR